MAWKSLKKLFSLKRIRSPKKFPEMGQISIHPRTGENFDFQLSLYAPSATSQKRISSTVLGRKLSSIRFPRYLTDHLIPVIGFLPQEASGYLQLSLRDGAIVVNRVNNKDSRRFARGCFVNVRESFSRMGLRRVPFSLQIPDAGAGFHLGASLPLGGEFVDRLGYLKSNKSIRIMDASLLPRIPAGGHTFLTMSLIDALMREQTCAS